MALADNFTIVDPGVTQPNIASQQEDRYGGISTTCNHQSTSIHGNLKTGGIFATSEAKLQLDPAHLHVRQKTIEKMP